MRRQYELAVSKEAVRACEKWYFATKVLFYFIICTYIPEGGVGLDMYTHTTQTLACCRLVLLALFSCAVRIVDGACYVYAYALMWTGMQCLSEAYTMTGPRGGPQPF